MSRMRLISGLALIVGAGAWLLANLPRLASKALRPPNRPVPHTPAEFGLPYESVTLRSPSRTKVHGWFIAAGSPAPALVVMHGWTANAGLMLPLAEPLRELGLHLLFLDGRGHGYSEPDEFTGAPQFAEDIEAGLDWLEKDPRVTSVALFGHSAGASASIIAASRRPEVAAVISVSGVADPRTVPWGRFPDHLRDLFMRYMRARTGRDLEEILPLARARRIQAPILVLHGDRDATVPVEQAHLLAEAAPRGELFIVPGADHTTLEKFVPARPRVTAFLQEHLAAAETSVQP